MIISSSKVGMSSSRQYTYYEERHSATLTERPGQAVELEISSEGKSLFEQMEEHQLHIKEQQQKKQQENWQKHLEDERARRQQGGMGVKGPSNLYEAKIEMLRNLLRSLQGGKLANRWGFGGKGYLDDFWGKGSSFSYDMSYKESLKSQISYRSSTSTRNVAGSYVFAGSNVWTKTTVQSSFVSEAEFTAFQSSGVARTKDGREIQFNVTVEMSRAFCEKYESFTQENVVVTDPLVINIDSDIADVTDMKFLFDIDADGELDEISFAGNGSGFLALDKNGDGVINDGSELFGTKSGNGFADLVAYDEDGNGWIDEADSIFNDLKIWMKDKDGNDVLLSLKDADVGAIYLGSADTEFSLKSGADHHTNGIVRRTGIYLKENGGVGTVQQIDLAV